MLRWLDMEEIMKVIENSLISKESKEKLKTILNGIEDINRKRIYALAYTTGYSDSAFDIINGKCLLNQEALNKFNNNYK